MIKRINNILWILLVLFLLEGCVSNNSATQVMATIGGMNAGATLGGAIGGLTSHTPKGHFMGTTIGALSGAALGAIATSTKNNSNTIDEIDNIPQKRQGLASLNGMRQDIRVTNVIFKDYSGDGVLQPGETAIVSYDIINVTPENIKLLIPKIELNKHSSRVHVSPMRNITNIPPGEGVRYTVTLIANDKLKSSDISLEFYLSRDNGSTYTLMNSIQFRTKKH